MSSHVPEQQSPSTAEVDAARILLTRPGLTAEDLLDAPVPQRSAPTFRDYIPIDFTDPEAILASPQLRKALDLGEPVGLLLVAMLMYFDPAEGHDPYPVVNALLDALPAGSQVAISPPTGDFAPDAMAAAQAVIRQAGIVFMQRSHAEVSRFFTDLELIGPGVVPVLAWRPDPQDTRRSTRRVPTTWPAWRGRYE